MTLRDLRRLFCCANVALAIPFLDGHPMNNIAYIVTGSGIAAVAWDAVKVAWVIGNLYAATASSSARK